MSADIQGIAQDRGCIPPAPCGRGAGGNGRDLPCDCEALAQAKIEVGMCVALDPDGRYGLFEDGGHAAYGGTIERIYDNGDVLVRFHDSEGWVEWSMPAWVVRPAYLGHPADARTGSGVTT